MEGSVLTAEPYPPNLAERNGQRHGGQAAYNPSGESMFSGTLFDVIAKYALKYAPKYAP